VHQRQTDQLIGLWLESDDPPAVSLTWLKVRDGIRPRTALFAVLLDAVGRGWAGLRPSHAASLLPRSAIASANAVLLAFIAPAPPQPAHDKRITSAAVFKTSRAHVRRPAHLRTSARTYISALLRAQVAAVVRSGPQFAPTPNRPASSGAAEPAPARRATTARL